MEYFYRDMRRKTGLLMTPDGKPEGGQWNLDKENRAPPRRGINYPEPLHIDPDAITAEVLALVSRRFADHFGRIDGFGLPVTTAQAHRALDHFIRTALPDFGTYQDAMVTGQDWLFHSWVSPALNIGPAHPAGNGAGSGGRLCGGRGAAKCGRRIHSPDHRLARICAWLLLAGNARCRRCQRAARDARAARILLDRGDRHALPGRGGAQHPRNTPMHTTSSG